MSDEIEPIEATVADLKPRMRGINITFKVIEKSEVRDVTSRKDSESHRVADAKVGDATGTVIMPLWDDAIEQLEVDKCYRLEKGYTTLFRRQLRLSIGRYGEIKDSEEDIEEINEAIDMSKEEHEVQFRRRRY